MPDPIKEELIDALEMLVTRIHFDNRLQYLLDSPEMRYAKRTLIRANLNVNVRCQEITANLSRVAWETRPETDHTPRSWVEPGRKFADNYLKED